MRRRARSNSQSSEESLRLPRRIRLLPSRLPDDVVGLGDLALRLNLPTGGTANQLVARIETMRAPLRMIYRWRTTLEVYQPDVLPDLTLTTLRWANNRVINTPALWPVVMLLDVVGENDLVGRRGTDGELLRSLHDRWSLHLTTDQKSLLFLRNSFIAVHSLIQINGPNGFDPEGWCERFWQHVVVPITSHVRQLIAVKLQSGGFASAARQVSTLAVIPLALHLGADLTKVVNKAAKNDVVIPVAPTTAAITDARAPRSSRSRQGGKSCIGCSAPVSVTPGQSVRDWFTAHNLVCTKKRKPKA